MTVPEMGNLPREGASTDTKVADAVPVAKPFGRADAASKKSVYDSSVSKDGRVAGVSLVLVAVDNKWDEEREATARGRKAEHNDVEEDAKATTRTLPRAIRDHIVGRFMLW